MSPDDDDPRPKRPARSPRPKRRRRLTPAHGVFVVVLALLAWRIWAMVDAGSPTGWDWVVLAILVSVLVMVGQHILEQAGRLAKLRNRGLGALAFVLSLSVASVTAVVVTGASPELGLDLQGGYSIVLTAEGNPPSENIDQAIEVIRARIDGLGVAEPEITRQGDSVVVDLPGIKDREEAQELVGRTAKLEFRPVLQSGLPFDAQAAEAGDDPCATAAASLAGATDPTATDPTATDPAGTDPAGTETTAPADPSSTTAPASTPADDDEEGAPAVGAPTVPGVADGEQAVPVPRQEDGSTTTTEPVESTTSTTVAGDTTTTTAPAGEPGQPADDTVVFPTQPSDDGPQSCTALGPVGFEGDALSKSQAQLGGSTGSEWVVAVAVKGGKQDQANTLFNACQAMDPAVCPSGQMAIVLDDQVVSAPVVNEPNLASDEFVIQGGGDGGFAEGDAKDLALVLRYGALPVEFVAGAERQVSPTVGEDSLRAGIIAGLAGLAVVILYLLIYYRALGIIVVMGMVVWSVLMYGLICWLSNTQGLTLSLSGVVGIVISIGTTVDSYVVHFERLKDEVRLGKSVRSSTERGFSLAFRTIVTANVAALIGAGLLWWLTVGAVRGFAFFLGLSVLLDLFVIWTFERPMVALFARSKFFTDNPVWGVARGLGRPSDDTPTEPAGVAS